VESTEEPVELVERVAALDLGKAGLVACVRVPHEDRPGRRRQEIREYATLSRSLLELADWLRCEGVELVAMEATSSYWKPVFYLLEAEGFTCWLLNARHVKNVPGRPKTDLLTELRGGLRSLVRRLPGGGARFLGHDRGEGRRAGFVPVGGCAVWVA
jgi:transposase